MVTVQSCWLTLFASLQPQACFWYLVDKISISSVKHCLYSVASSVLDGLRNWLTVVLVSHTFKPKPTTAITRDIQRLKTDLLPQWIVAQN